MVAMALLPSMVGIQTATPLVALVAVTIEFFLLVRYRRALNLRVVLPIIFAAVVGVPLGIWGLSVIEETVILPILGVLIIGYALYALFKIKLPELINPAWAYGTGLIAGMLGGAYNVSGPPVIVYGDCKRWPRAEFKGNLQGFFLITSLFVAIGHAVGGNLSSEVVTLYVWAIPAMALGILTGTFLDRFLDPDVFRKVVLVLLIVLGVRLIL